ncbi:MAG: SDR family NAD(P)-dependent oxidoreductase [Terrimonas sp.]|nr:SDR family NAD(P)-dependent oxidoreductase [Terrimonas sp.]
MNVVITGASKGMGRAMAEIFAANGHNLFLCSRGEEQLKKTMEEIHAKNPGIKVKAKARDLSKKEEAQSFGKWILDNGYPIDVLINNAGQFIPGSIYQEEDGTLEQMMSVNLYSAYHLTRVIVPDMIRKKSGHIFNICSIAALKAYSNGGSYSISKYAMHGFSKNLREELKPFNIKVTSVFPGAVLTESWGDFDNTDNRIMVAEDVAEMVYAATRLSAGACVEDIVLRPQLGDL